MTHYENERSLPVYTKPFAKRRVVYSNTATIIKRRCQTDPCEICRVRQAIEGDEFTLDYIHTDTFVFKRRYLNYSKEENLVVTFMDNYRYWKMVNREIGTLNARVKSKMKR